VPRRVDQVQLVRLAALRRVRHAHGVELDRDAALALESSVSSTWAFISRFCSIPVSRSDGRRAWTSVVDVGDDAEVADMVELQRMSR
jgi:hypothetical protein